MAATMMVIGDTYFLNITRSGTAVNWTTGRVDELLDASSEPHRHTV